MAEYSRIATGQVVSNGSGQTLVVIPFIPNYIAIYNRTRAVAGAGVTNAQWFSDMGQGSAFLSTFGTGVQFIAPVGGTSSGALVSGTGFTTIQAGLSLQFGPVYQHTASTDFSIAVSGAGGAAPATTITTTTNHNLTTGNWIIFSNLYQTATTGMQQIAGIPFMVTVTGATTFTIFWDTSNAVYTAFNTATSLNNVGSFKQILYPVLYAPNVSWIAAITRGATTTIQTTVPHNLVVGSEVAFRIPKISGLNQWGTIELNSLPDVIIPGSPIYGYVVSVTNSTTVVVNIDSTTFTAFNVAVPFLSFVGLKYPQMVAVGDVNTGGWPISAGSDLYPSPQVFNGFVSSTSVGARTINGPAIQGAFINATFQGFIIGSSVGGTAADVIYWEAIMSDKNYP
jgi:hypothetical protein